MRLFILFVVLSSAFALYSQQEEKVIIPDSMKINPMKPDSVKADRFLLMQDFALFSPPSSLRYRAVDFSNSNGFKSFLGRDLRMSSDFLSPLYNKYLDDQKMAPYMYILGLAEGAATGYLLYQHIKEYGIWDNKKKKRQGIILLPCHFYSYRGEL